MSLILIGKIAVGLTLALLAAATASDATSKTEHRGIGSNTLIAALAFAAALAFVGFQYRAVKTAEIEAETRKERNANYEMMRRKISERERLERERRAAEAAKSPPITSSIQKRSKSRDGSCWRYINGGPVNICD